MLKPRKKGRLYDVMFAELCRPFEVEEGVVSRDPPYADNGGATLQSCEKDDTESSP